LPPASIKHTLWAGLALKRLANTQPAEPAPIIMKSYIADTLVGEKLCCNWVVAIQSAEFSTEVQGVKLSDGLLRVAIRHQYKQSGKRKGKQIYICLPLVRAG